MTWLEFIRWLLLILCAETAIRFGWWSRKVHRDPEQSYALLPLMIGVAIGMFGFAVFALYALIFSANLPPDDPGRTAMLVFGDTAIVIATILHLVPCWRMSCLMPWWRLPVELAGRGAVAALGALFIT